MSYFNHFLVKELFPYCSRDEIIECLEGNFMDSLLILLEVLDGFRDYVDKPIIITSSFRNSLHNKSVGGSPTSQHLLGQAVDFYVRNMPHETAVYFLKEFLQKSALERFVGQVIFYDNFFHIGLRTSSHKNLVYYDKRNLEKSN